MSDTEYTNFFDTVNEDAFAQTRLQQSPDQLEVSDIRVTQEDLNSLCDNLTGYVRKLRYHPEAVAITVNRLASMRVVRLEEDRIVPTIAYAILAGELTTGVSYNIQCMAFKGITRESHLMEAHEYQGPIYTQIDCALDFVMKWIVCTPIFEKAYRIDHYELPIDTIRELIVNAVCHRSYLFPSQIQVVVFEDRVEITSPGMLSSELAIDKICEGYSVIRNRSLVGVFRYLHLAERMGTGIPRAISSCKEYGLREPDLEAMDSTFKVIIYRDPSVR